jgi:aldehyde:ferredoxin oxidoreductase
MPFALFTGPLAGTDVPGSGLTAVVSRSPLSATIGDCLAGGSLGCSIKRAGYDGIVISGRAGRLRGLEIDGRRVTITDATVLEKAGTAATHASLTGKGATVTIGPAAENGVLFANLTIDGRFATGRNGLGLVMASKNLKYVAVRGAETTTVQDRPALQEAREDIMRLIAASSFLSGEQGIAAFGTGALFDLLDTRRMMPTRNFTATHFDGARAMNAFAYRTDYHPVMEGCEGCPVRCLPRSPEGFMMPGLEAMVHFGALLDNHDRSTVVSANRICGDTGMDATSAAVTLAAHAEITGRKLDKDGIESLLLDTAMGRGEGRELSTGAARYCTARGRPACAMTVKKQELPAYDPRGAYGMALGYALSTRGGCHRSSYPITHEILRKPVATDRFSFDGKARIIKISEDTIAVAESLSVCPLLLCAASLEECARAYTAVTGVASSTQELLAAGQRIYYHERIMNTACGFTAADDDLPARFFEHPGTGGNAIEIPALSRDDFLAARARYYRIRGLTDNGLPTRHAAKAMGLPW